MTRARNSANLASDGNLFVDIANDRTGIGSVAPAQNLHVAGTAGFHADTTFVGDLYNTTWDRSTNSLNFADSAQLKLGTGGDIKLYHSGSHSFFTNATGNFHIRTDTLKLEDQSNGHSYITAVADGAVDLYHDNLKKFETTAYGTNTTGTAVNDGLVVAGVATVTTMNVTGVLTYDDVTSVDSVGIVTARAGVDITGGSLSLDAGGSERFNVSHVSGGNVLVKNPTAANLTFETHTNTSQLQLHNGGNIGMGVGSPSDTLHISKASANHGIKLERTSSLTGSVSIQVQSNGALKLESDNNISYISGSSQQHLFYRGSSTEIARFDTSGRLIVGATAVVDNSIAEFHRSIGGGAQGCHILVNNTSTDSVNNTARLKLRTAGGGTAEFFAYAAPETYLRSRTGGTANLLLLADGSSKIQMYTNGNERFVVHSNGNLKIGSGTPALAVGSGLEIDTGSAATIRLEDSGSTSSFEIQNTGGVIKQNMYNNQPWTVAYAGTEKLRIDSSGRVIIGSTSVSPATSYTDNLVVSEASANAGIQIIGNNSNSNYATFGLGDAGGNLRSYLEAQLGANGNFTIGTAGTGNIRFLNSGGERLRIDGNGNIAHNSSGSGISYFKGSSEYIFGSNTSSPPAGGNEANVQIHTSKTRASFSINAYYNNAGGPFMQFLTSRSGTVGTLGTKVQSNDYLGEIRFSGDNGTNYNSVAHGATIWARAKSTPADGDTVIHGELNFAVGTTDGTDGVKDRLTIQESGRIKFHEDPVQRNSTVDNFTGDGAYMQHYVARTGSQYRRNLDIASVGDGSWGSSIRFSTNSDSNATTAERMRLNHNGELAIGGDYTQTTHKLQVDNGTSHFKSRVFIRGTMSFNSTPFGANVTYDTGISVNAGGYGGSILAICSKNYGSGTNTQSGVYLIKFHYDGNNTPSITLIAGSNLATFAQSASNTLTVAMGASNNMFTAIESSVVPT